MNLEVIDLQEEQCIENDMPYVDQKRIKRAKRRRRSRIYTILGLSCCLVVIVAAMYLGLTLWEAARNTAEDAVADAAGMADMEKVTYTQQELDEKLREAEAEAKSQAQLAADARAEEILGDIKQSLESGVSTIEMLRVFYPEDIVLSSGGTFHFVPIKDTLKKNDYDEACLNILESGEYQYVENGQVVSYKGIDVSSHQGNIDWEKVADDGVKFAFIRVAFRGYGTGKLVEDEKFEQNIKGALAAGIKVGGYIYSQAISEEELLEEAKFVLEKIAPYKLDCPVVYDVEMVSGDDGRMNNLSVEERTRLSALFCETIENAGYKAMIYHNMEMGALKVNLEELENYDKWFAYYNPNFYYPYEYDVWQYSDKGKIDGIKGDVDLNISFIPLWE